MHYTSEAKAQIAGEYVLGLAPRPLERAVRRRMRRDPELAALVGKWEQSLHELGQAMPVSQAVGEHVWARIAAELPAVAWTSALGPAAAAASGPRASSGSGQSAIADAPASLRKWWQQLWVWQGWAVAASALALVLGLQPQITSRQADPFSAAQNFPATEISHTAEQAATDESSNAVPPNTVARVAPAAGDDETARRDSAAADDQTASPVTASERPAVAGLADAARAAGAHEPAATTGAQQAQSSAGSVVRSTRELEGSDSQPATPATASVTPSRDGRTRSAADAVTASQTTTQTALVGVLTDGSTGGAAWLLRWDQQTETLHVRVLADQSPGPERDFELWAVPADGGPPKAIGLISGSRSSALQLDRQLGRSVRMAQALAVSVEPAGGSPAAGPTGPVKFTGALQQI